MDSASTKVPILEKVKKQVTWADELENCPEKQAQKPEPATGAGPAQLKQYMNLTYNSKETQIDKSQTKEVVHSKVSFVWSSSLPMITFYFIIPKFRLRPSSLEISSSPKGSLTHWSGSW